MATGLLLCGAWPAWATSSDGAGSSWPSLQGGPEHLGSAPLAAQPPLRVTAPSGWPSQAVSAIVSIPGLAVADGSQSVIGFDPGTGSVLWTVPRARGPLDPPAIAPLVGRAGAVVFPEGSGSNATGLVAIDTATRRQLWRFALSRPARGAPTISGGTVYFGCQDGFVYALDASNGTMRWKAKTIGPVDASPAVAAGKVFDVAESAPARQARLYALNEADGTTLWTYVTSISALGSSTPTVAGGSVFVGLGDFRIHALNAQTGRLEWTARTRGVFAPSSAPAFAAGSVYVADDSGGLYRLGARDGAKIWDYQFTALTGNGAPLVAGGVTYLGLADGTIEAVDSAGFLIWSARVSRGPVGPLTPDGAMLLAPTQAGGGSRGGVIALRHDPSGAIVHVVSPTKLQLGLALLDYAAAVVLVMIALLVLFGFVNRRAKSARLPAPAGDRGGVPEPDAPPGSRAEEVDA